MPRYKVLIEKKVLLSIIVNEEDTGDALQTVTKFVTNNYPNKEVVTVIEGLKVLESPLNISVIGAPEFLDEDKKEFIVETKGN